MATSESHLEVSDSMILSLIRRARGREIILRSVLFGKMLTEAREILIQTLLHKKAIERENF